MIASLVATIAIVGLSAQSQQAEAAEILAYTEPGNIWVSNDIPAGELSTEHFFVNEQNAIFCGINANAVLDLGEFTQVNNFFTPGQMALDFKHLEGNQVEVFKGLQYTLLTGDAVAIISEAECRSLVG